jgi:hypothetical protein
MEESTKLKKPFLSENEVALVLKFKSFTRSITLLSEETIIPLRF